MGILVRIVAKLLVEAEILTSTLVRILVRILVGSQWGASGSQ